MWFTNHGRSNAQPPLLEGIQYLVACKSLGKEIDEMLERGGLRKLRKFTCMKISQAAEHYSYAFFCSDEQFMLELRRTIEQMGFTEEIDFELTLAHRSYFVKPCSWKCDCCGEEVEARDGALVYSKNARGNITKCGIVHRQTSCIKWIEPIKPKEKALLWDTIALALNPSQLSLAFEMLKSDVAKTSICRIFLRGYEELFRKNPNDRLLKICDFPSQRAIAERLASSRKKYGDFVTIIDFECAYEACERPYGYYEE
jgi:hypothetical protein